MQDVTFTLVSAIFYASSAFFLSRAVMSQFFVYFTKNPSHEAYPAFTRAYVSISQPTSYLPTFNCSEFGCILRAMIFNSPDYIVELMPIAYNESIKEGMLHTHLTKILLI